jgi:parallel beta-helix repeat protein
MSGYGIHLYHSSNSKNSNNIIRHNYIYDNGDRGILIGSGSNNIAENNFLRNNGQRSGQGGITVGYNNAINNQVFSNTIRSNAGSCVRILPTSINANVRDNVCWQNDNDGISDSGVGSLIVANHERPPN